MIRTETSILFGLTRWSLLIAVPDLLAVESSNHPSRRAKTATEHRLPFFRRPDLPSLELLRGPASIARDAPYGSYRQRRNAVRPLPGHQFDLRS